MYELLPTTKVSDMYQPIEFQEPNPAFATKFVEEHPFGVIAGVADGRIGAAHLPFQLVKSAGALVLEGHGAARNQWLADLKDGTDVIVIFSGSHAYITPNAYRAEADVPTWNYTAVHVRGRYRRLEEGGIPGVLERTVRLNERGEMGSGWSTSSMSRDDLNSLARGVIAFHIDIDEISAGRKLSQDKLREDVDAVKAHLDACPSAAAQEVARDMREAGVDGRTGEPSTDPAVWLGPLA